MTLYGYDIDIHQSNIIFVLINLLKQWHQTSIALESLDDLNLLGCQLEIENLEV